MIRINYDGSLKKDINNVNKEGKKSDIFLIRILNDLIACLISIPIFLGLNRLFSFEINWAVSLSTIFTLNTITVIRSIIKDIKERKEKALDSRSNIRELAYLVNLELEENANNLVSEITPEAIYDAVTTREIDNEEDYVLRAYGIDGHKKKIKTETTNFFLLDAENKIKVLREIKKEIKELGETNVERDLYLLNDEEVPAYVPVVRILERK